MSLTSGFAGSGWVSGCQAVVEFEGAIMKMRLFAFTLSALLLSTHIFGQNTNPALRGDNAGDATVPTAAPIEDKEYLALPMDRHFVRASNEAGESSSRKHPSLPAGSVDTRPCEEPAKLFSARDYNGPMQRITAWFSRKPEKTTVPPRRWGQKICSLDAGQKFYLFYTNTVDPVTVVGAGFAAGISQWQDNDSEWGQGAEGYGKRYAAAFTDRATRNFFAKFFYPTIFRQDPRYFRRGRGTFSSRFGHAVEHPFVAKSDAGNPTPNISLWAGIVSAESIANLYHPGNDRGAGPTAERVGIRLGAQMGGDVLKEFWPEIVRTLHLPFKQRKIVPEGAGQNP